MSYIDDKIGSRHTASGLPRALAEVIACIWGINEKFDTRSGFLLFVSKDLVKSS